MNKLSSTETIRDLRRRVIYISRELNLAHIGSCLSVLPVLREIYSVKGKNDIVIMDNAHAHLAHLVIKESYGMLDKQDTIDLIKTVGIHCDRKAGCDVSGGSLGHGIGIGIGHAITDRKRNVYVIVSDGSMMEGSNWEALRIKDSLKLKNLKIYTNFNEYTAVAKIDRDQLARRMKAFCSDIEVRFTNNTPEFAGLAGHYMTI